MLLGCWVEPVAERRVTRLHIEMESSNEAENPQQTVSDDEDLPNIQEHEADEVIVLDQGSTFIHSRATNLWCKYQV